MIIDITTPSLEKFDLGGVLYHANYFHLFEQTREKFLELSKLPYPELVKENSHLAIVKAEIDYLKSIFYGDKIEIDLTCSKIKKTNFWFHYKITRSSKIITTASSKMVFVKNLVPRRIPEKLSIALKKVTREENEENTAEVA